MRFERLRLTGFKSFVEPTELVIRDGLTGVVGPNGCGKSNLLEAIRWVMGEASAKSLRVASGGGMDDVIFAGTAKRPARDLAEVRLVLDNRDRRAPAEFNGEDRLEVSRAIARDEGSTYAVNGREVRQKDVQLLFADAATGAHSPALVSQGRVAAIIAARPQDRRLLLEEAAGISGLNVRRREAELRLRAADANLVRLDDVMKASEAQAAGLRRQARAAERYRSLSADILCAEQACLRLAHDAADAQLRAAEQALRLVDATLAEAVATAARASTAQADAAAGLPPKRLAEANAAARLQRLTTERATLVAERAGLQQRLADLAAAIDSADADQERARARARDSAATQARLTEERALREAAAAEAAQRTAPLAAEVLTAERATTAAERDHASALEAHASLVAEARSARAQAEAAKGRAERIAGELARLEREQDRLSAGSNGASLAAEVEMVEAALAAKGAEAEAANAAIATAERDAGAARQAADAVEKALASARSEVASLEAEAAALDRLRAGKTAAAGRGSARSQLQAAPGFEAAVAAALGEDIHAALGADAASGKAERRWLGVPTHPEDPSLPQGVTPLASRVTAPAELARRMAQLGLVDAPPDAALLAALKPGQRLVDRAGGLWRWDGYVAPPGGQAVAVAEALAQENRRREIAALLDAPRARLAAAEAELVGQKARLAQAQADERMARAARAEAERAREQMAGRLQGLRAAAAQAAARASAIAASIERLRAEGESAAGEAQLAAETVAGLPDASAAAQAVAAARTAAERCRATLAQARAAAAAIERELAESRARVIELGRELSAWSARDSEAADAAAQLQARLDRLKQDHAELVGAPAAHDARLALLDREIAEAEVARTAAAEAVMAADLALGDLDRQARAADAAVADGREQRATLAARVTQFQDKCAELIGQSEQRFSCAPDRLVVPEGADLAGLEQRLAAMVAERERLGVVNLRADIELQEIDAALATQSAERAELETAIARLRGAIGSLNREGRARLMTAFQTVDQHFRDLFVTLFGGGAAELQMIESDDPLEAGLEIRAQPPGKRLQSLSLLSGGEQALTAIALIFALFRTNPAPICVLDEVDAPLDDANVERFTRLLDHMTQVTDTRFLIVTHNAVTMAAMHRLYGVTMAEAGVSQLVSVELTEAEALLAA